MFSVFSYCHPSTDDHHYRTGSTPGLNPNLPSSSITISVPTCVLSCLSSSFSGVLRRVTIDHHANSCTGAITTLFKYNYVHTEPSPASVHLELVLFLFIVDKPLVFHLLRGQSVLDRSHVLLFSWMVVCCSGMGLEMLLQCANSSCSSWSIRRSAQKVTWLLFVVLAQKVQQLHARSRLNHSLVYMAMEYCDPANFH